MAGAVRSLTAFLLQCSSRKGRINLAIREPSVRDLEQMEERFFGYGGWKYRIGSLVRNRGWENRRKIPQLHGSEPGKSWADQTSAIFTNFTREYRIPVGSPGAAQDLPSKKRGALSCWSCSNSKT